MTDKKTDRRGLGRGLSALMADVPEAPEQGAGPRRPEVSIPTDQIAPNPDQPRRRFNAESLDELAASIREKGIIQPLILRQIEAGEAPYQIVAGERRWRAAQIAQLHEVPAIIREFDDTEVLEVAIIENIQRADLNPVDEAAGYRQLMDRFGHTQEMMATALGKSRSHIANLLRLLSLPQDVQDMLGDGALSMGHARALITADNPSELAQQVVKKRLSVREAEKLAKTSGQATRTAKRQRPEKDADTKALEADLSAHLGMKISIDHSESGDNGRLILNYTSLDQLDDLCRRLSGNE